MQWLKANIDKIAKLKVEGSSESLTYAALECRLAIEKVCYERLRIAHGYISAKEIRKWQPKEVVLKLLQSVDKDVARSYTLSISKNPVPLDKDLILEEFESFEYLTVGRSIGLDPKRLGELWQSVSSFLHVSVPKSTTDVITEYADPEKMRRKIDEVIQELEILSQGNIISSGFGEIVNFECKCGATNNRRLNLLKNREEISCINPNCKEIWVVNIGTEEINFSRKTINISCRHCRKEILFPERYLIELGLNLAHKFNCPQCNEMNYVMWRLCQASEAHE